jgi:hypothetical protein
MPRKHVRLPLALVIGASALSLARAHSVLALTATAEGVTSASFHVSTLVYALAALAALATAAMAWPRREQTAARNLIALLLAAGWWAGAITVESAVTSPSAKLLWSQIAYLGTTCVPLCYLLFAAALAGHDGLLSPARIGSWLFRQPSPWPWRPPMAGTAGSDASIASITPTWPPICTAPPLPCW